MIFLGFSFQKACHKRSNQKSLITDFSLKLPTNSFSEKITPQTCAIKERLNCTCMLLAFADNSITLEFM
jgi:hypothetical protein